MKIYNRIKWIENFHYRTLNTDPFVIKQIKAMREILKNWRKLIITILIISIASWIFTYFEFDLKLQRNIIYRTLLIILNVITFVGVFFPVTIKKNFSKKEIEKIQEDKKKKDLENAKIENRAKFLF